MKNGVKTFRIKMCGKNKNSELSTNRFFII